ncbi:MAG: adenine phosphoribosyltransferase [Chloroflexi bacterium]|nr:adenine phosphoribosyltransferase [Chloroflexota bacterium]
MDLKRYIRDVPGFPEPNVIFRDITPLLQEPKAFQYVIDQLATRYRPMKIDAVVGIEARGFIFGAPLALAMNSAFVPIRKKGKLPHATVQMQYALEYGTATIEIHKDAVAPNKRVLIVDDVLATGGTLIASRQLIEKIGGHVAGLAVIVELTFLKGRERLGSDGLFSLVSY